MDLIGLSQSKKITEIVEDYVDHLNSDLFTPLGRRLHSIMSYQSLKEGAKFHKRYKNTNKDLVSPVFVVGLPRSGTTNLHNLIINNFSFTGNQFWELSSPSMISNNKYINEKLRRFKSSIGFYFYRYLIPSIQSMHRVNMDTYEECWHFQKNLFLCYNYVIQLKFLQLEDFMLQMDTSILLDKYKNFILSKNTSTSIALKCPDHMMFLTDISNIFPDAKFIWIHRNPIESISSYCPMINSVWKLFFRNVQKKDVGNFIVDLYERMLLRAMNDREKIDNLFIDVSYSQLIKDRNDVIEYLSGKLKKKIIVNNKSRKSNDFFKNKFKFDIKEYGLSIEEINKRFSFYTEKYVQE